MADRITNVPGEDGIYNVGSYTAELDTHPGLLVSQRHFESDPVMLGCLGLYPLWQLLGFYLGWAGGAGKGPALGAGSSSSPARCCPLPLDYAIARAAPIIAEVVVQSAIPPAALQPGPVPGDG